MFSEHDERMSSERPLTSSYYDMVDILREQFQVAQERERDYREHIARLTTMLDQAHQQNQRLLEAPRPASVTAPAARAPSALAAPRGEMRRLVMSPAGGNVRPAAIG